jgi:outer membrane biosynthesis protein TonB
MIYMFKSFRYTYNQRRLEIITKKYMKITKKVKSQKSKVKSQKSKVKSQKSKVKSQKSKVNIESKINNQTIKQIESTLSILNSKTFNYEEFKKYILEKNKVNETLYKHY